LAKNLKVMTATIAAGGTTTATVTCEGGRIPLALELPSVLTGTTLTFKAASASEVTPTSLYDEGSAYSVTVSTSRFVSLKRSVFEGVRFFQIVSGSTESGADRVIKVITGE